MAQGRQNDAERKRRRAVTVLPTDTVRSVMYLGSVPFRQRCTSMHTTCIELVACVFIIIIGSVRQIGPCRGVDLLCAASITLT